MKKLLLLLLISLGFIGLANANPNPIDGAFGYKLGLVEKDAELQEDTSGFKYKSKSFIPSKVMPPFTSYTIKTTLTKNKIYEITAYVSKIKYDTFSCDQNIYFKDLLSALKRKYKEHGKLLSFRWNDSMDFTFIIDDRSIVLECEADYDEMSMQLTYSDDKLLDMLKKGNNIYSDFDI